MSSCTDKESLLLERFIEAQEGIYNTVLTELRAGKKQSHWMWFIFPQMAGLGRSSTASFYAIKSAAEAEAYLRHPMLGSRLRECTTTVLNLEGLSLTDIFDYPDNLKFCSSMTLFNFVAPRDSIFESAIIKYCKAHKDARTLQILNAGQA